MLDPEVAAGFLVDRTGDADRRAALELAGALGGLPLALEQAAAYVQATGNSLAGYLAAVPSGGGRTFWPGASRPGTPGRWRPRGCWRSPSWRSRRRARPGLLRLLAFCAPDAVPLGLLLQPRPGLADQLPAEVAPVLGPLLDDEVAGGDAVVALRRYSLVRPAGDRVVSVHRLVQAVTADQMPEDAGVGRGGRRPPPWSRPPSLVIHGSRRTWPVFAALLPHAQAALPADSAGMVASCPTWGTAAAMLAARELWRGIREDRARKLGPDDPGTLLARAEFAGWTGAAGDAAGARDQYAALLPVRERVSGAEHPEP